MMKKLNKILIVEDDDQNRILFKDLLEIHGYETASAANGRDGLAMARQFKPHIVLMDIQMPVQDGISTIRELRGDPELGALPVIAISAYAMKGDRERILAAGFDHYLAKPIDTMELPAIIESVLATRHVKGGIRKNDQRVAHA